ncbi:MAG TPA: molecular chaperone Hsp20 [Rhodopirellula sp.]|nr:molecular chaperone Hsp20 [Rhodopirellula sp.]
MLNHNTFAQMHRLKSELERVFGSDLTNNGCPQIHPKVNVWEDLDCFLIEAELPGVNLDDLEIHVHQGTQLSIKGERKGIEDPAITWVRNERFVGDFARTLKLGCSVDAEGVQANLRNGVLAIRLPKTAAHKPHKIEIETGV